jgi:hypothetical protein
MHSITGQATMTSGSEALRFTRTAKSLADFSGRAFHFPNRPTEEGDHTKFVKESQIMNDPDEHSKSSTVSMVQNRSVFDDLACQEPRPLKLSSHRSFI